MRHTLRNYNIELRQETKNRIIFILMVILIIGLTWFLCWGISNTIEQERAIRQGNLILEAGLAKLENDMAEVRKKAAEMETSKAITEPVSSTIITEPITTTVNEVTHQPTTQQTTEDPWTEPEEFKSTFYILEGCGREPGDPDYGKTASGTFVKAGRTIAVDPKLIPYGTKLKITCPDYPEFDGIYIAEDCGGFRGYNLDIYVEKLEDIPAVGRVNLLVQRLKEGD